MPTPPFLRQIVGFTLPDGTRTEGTVCAVGPRPPEGEPTIAIALSRDEETMLAAYDISDDEVPFSEKGAVGHWHWSR